jgi:predicted unusual protein kinase regulating ubiquinone biosynthesis (AarF/ABC1/UbiB family)
MDYLKGESIYYIDKELCGNYSTILADFIFDSIFERNLLHGDLHPGNIIFIKENSDKNGENIFKIGFIDFGIVCKFEDIIKTKIYIFLKYSFDKNYDDLFKYSVLNLVEKINPDDEREIDNDKVVKELLEVQKKYNLLECFIKNLDIYYINLVLKKYNLKISEKINSLLVFLCCMYSLLFILKTNKKELYSNRFKYLIEKKEENKEKNNQLLLEKIRKNRKNKDFSKILQGK